MLSRTKRGILFQKSAIFMVLLLLLVAVFSCGLFQSIDHTAVGSEGAIGCSSILPFVTTNGLRDNILLSLSFLLLLVLFVIKKFIAKKTSNVFKSLLPTIFKFTKSVQCYHKNSIQEAFRRGIIHSQIYNLSFIRQ